MLYIVIVIQKCIYYYIWINVSAVTEVLEEILNFHETCRSPWQGLVNVTISSIITTMFQLKQIIIAENGLGIGLGQGWHLLLQYSIFCHTNWRQRKFLIQ